MGDKTGLKIRITSGELRGRQLKSPQVDFVHPMGAREKLALFNMIGESLSGARVLDAFAGSGALGIEALSRGAKEVVFVEKSPRVIKVILENLRDLNLLERSLVFTGDVVDFNTTTRFEIILADPPYDCFEAAQLSNLTKFLKDGGNLILSHPESPPVVPGLKLIKTRKYAAANLSIYKKA